MYEAFYGLKEKPFSIQPDPDFLFFSQRHRLAFAMLEYGIHNRAGFSVITGEIGCGKTTLIRHLLNNLGPDIRIGLISNTHKNIVDPLEWVMMAFDQPYEHKSAVALFDGFQHFLIAEYAAGRRVVLIIDEAQNLNPEALESLRMLSNINADKDQLLQIILVGQPQLKALLRRPELQQFAQRISVDFHLQRLCDAEVGLYILHRLKVAGRETPLFSHEALMRIAEVTGGIPRSINILCDTALVYGYSLGIERIERRVIDEVVNDKQKYGIFNTPATDDAQGSASVAGSDVQGGRGAVRMPGATAEPPLDPPDETRKPALVIYDRELAKELLEKMRQEKKR